MCVFIDAILSLSGSIDGHLACIHILATVNSAAVSVVHSFSCVRLWGDPMACSPPGSSIHGISQARIMEWVAISFSGDFPNPGIEPAFPALQVDSLLLSYQGSHPFTKVSVKKKIVKTRKKSFYHMLLFLSNKRNFFSCPRTSFFF